MNASAAQPTPPSWAARVAGWLARVFASPSSPLDSLRADGPVTFSGCSIAARRAVESTHPQAIARDPLAASLAGRAAVDAAKRRGSTRGGVSAMAIRTRWFDDEIVQALETGRGAAVEVGMTPHGDRLSLTITPPTPTPTPPRQVVALGAGMDARPWRLPLPPGTRWWEVDVDRVLAVKGGLLTRAARAGGVPMDLVTTSGWQPLPQPRAPRTIAHPLHAATLAFVAADVGARGWGHALATAHHDATTPTLFIAEGIIMYMDGEAGAAALLSEAASIAAPGSLLLVVSVTAAAAAAARARANKQFARSAWTFGCDAIHPERLLAATGWRVVGADTRSDMARRYATAIGGRPLEFSVRPPGTRSQGESLFMVAERFV